MLENNQRKLEAVDVTEEQARTTYNKLLLDNYPGYTRTVGQVFGPAVTLVFVVKTVLFSLAVAVVPMAVPVAVGCGCGFMR